MPLSSSSSAPAPGPDSSQVSSLWEHRQHVFIFTRAGKPVFSLHGEEERHSPLFALFQVLLHMSDSVDGAERDFPATSAAPAEADDVRQVVYYQPYADSTGCGAREVQALTIFLYVQGELMYVMTQRSAPPDAADAGVEGCRAGAAPLAQCDAAFTPPPVASYCAAQLRHLHHFVLLVLPTINAMLARQPSLDVMSTYTESDRGALRELIESYACRLTYAVGAMATLTLTVEKRRVVEGALLKAFRSASDASVGPPAQQLFSFVFYQDYLVAAVGPPEMYAAPVAEADRIAPLAFGPADACCGGLHVDDALLLYRYARSLVRRQVGEAWAPVCLPRFNGSGYLWCYAVNFSRHIRDLRGDSGLSVWPPVWAAGTEQDVLLLHVSAAQDDFTPLSRCTRRFAQLLYSPVIGDNFYYRLEEEMGYRTPAPLTELLGPLHVSSTSSASSAAAASRTPPPTPPPPSSAAHDRSTPNPPSSHRTTGVPLWYAVVLQGGDANFLVSEEVAEAHSTSEAAAAAVAAFAAPSRSCATADVRLLFESQPSPLLHLTTIDDVKAFQQCVVRYQAQLRALPASASSPSMLLVRHSSSAVFALVQPTVATLTVLAQHFFHTTAPFDIPPAVMEDEREDLAGTGREGREKEEEEVPPSRRGVTFTAFVEAVRASGVTEVTAVFAASTPEALVWYWVARLLFMAVQRRGRYVVRQLVGR